MIDNMTLKDSNNKHLRVWCEDCENFITTVYEKSQRMEKYDGYVCMNCGRLVVIVEKG